MLYYYKSSGLCDNLPIEMYVSNINFTRFNWHQELELFILLRGCVDLYIDGMVSNLQQNDVLLIPANHGHAMASTDAFSCALVVHFSTDEFLTIVPELKNIEATYISTEQTRNSSNFRHVRQYCAQMMLAGVSGTAAQQLMFRGAFLMLLGTLAENFSHRRAERKNTPNTVNFQRSIVKVIKYMEKNYSRRITLNDVANLTGYNRSYFSTFFRKHIGIGFYDYLTRIRFRHALYLLSITNRSITDIAIECGFPDLKTFTMYYKKIFNNVPSRRHTQEDSPYHDLAVQERMYIGVGTPDIDAKLHEYARDF